MTYRRPATCFACGCSLPHMSSGCPETEAEEGPTDTWTGVDEPAPAPEAEPAPFASTTSYPTTDEDIF